MKPTTMTDGAADLAPTVFFSDHPDPTLGAELGGPGGWRANAVAEFGRAFEMLGWGTRRLTYPEVYPSAHFLPDGGARGAGPDGRALHVSFRPPDRFNLVKGAWNVLALPWRYPLLTDAFLWDTKIQENLAHMLGLADEVWTTNAAAAETLRRYDVAAVRIPSPTPTVTPAPDMTRRLEGFLFVFDGFAPRSSPRARLRDLLRRGRGGDETRLFVTVIDPDDAALNAEALIRGFAVAAQRAGAGPDAALVATFALDPERRGRLRPGQIANGLGYDRFKMDADVISDRILLVADALSPAELAALFSKADFYLCAAAADDQNLPLQLAMAHGAVPVSTRVGSMADDLDDACSIEIQTRPGALSTEGTPIAAAAARYEAHIAEPRDVAAAIRQAVELDDAARERLSAAARRTAEERFTVSAAARRLQERRRAARDQDGAKTSDGGEARRFFKALSGLRGDGADGAPDGPGPEARREPSAPPPAVKTTPIAPRRADRKKDDVSDKDAPSTAPAAVLRPKPKLAEKQPPAAKTPKAPQKPKAPENAPDGETGGLKLNALVQPMTPPSAPEKPPHAGGGGTGEVTAETETPPAPPTAPPRRAPIKTEVKVDPEAEAKPALAAPSKLGPKISEKIKPRVATRTEPDAAPSLGKPIAAGARIKAGPFTSRPKIAAPIAKTSPPPVPPRTDDGASTPSAPREAARDSDAPNAPPAGASVKPPGLRISRAPTRERPAQVDRADAPPDPSPDAPTLPPGLRAPGVAAFTQGARERRRPPELTPEESETPRAATPAKTTASTPPPAAPRPNVDDGAPSFRRLKIAVREGPAPDNGGAGPEDEA